MKKKIFCTLSILLAFSSIQVYANDNLKLEPINFGEEIKPTEELTALDNGMVYYPDATIESATQKYKDGNYSGCLQELFSLVKDDPSNALAYYYMAMAYTHVNMKNEAVQAYEKVLALNPNEYLVQYATKGKDCLTDGPTCKPQEEVAEDGGELTDLDRFINAPYGDGMSPESAKAYKDTQLKTIQQTINGKENLEVQDFERIQKLDDNKSSIDENDKLAMVTDEEVLNAINTLKEAGLNVTVQSDNPYLQMNQYVDPKMAEMSMLLGNNNNNNSNSMMNMIPMMMSQAQKGENIDPRIMQTMMMSSMMSDFTNTNNNNRY